MPSLEPQYLQYSLTTLKKIADDMHEHYECCRLCPHQCKANRNAGQKGFCKAGTQIRLGSASLHWGEEPPITGTRGSGTLFFSHCTLHCFYCQNYPLSQLHYGEMLDEEALADRMLRLQKEGAHNLNWVTPTQFLPSSFRALILAREKGLRIPIVYNTSGWECEPVLGWFEYFVDGFLADTRFYTEEVAKELSRAVDYQKNNEITLKTIRKQLPEDYFDSENILQKGVIIRILMLPHYIDETVNVIYQLKEWLGNEVHVSLMSQYFPAYKAFQHPHMRRRINRKEYNKAVSALEACGFEKGWVQPYESES